MPRFKRKKITKDAAGIKHGYRSGLEKDMQKELEALNIEPNFEGTCLKYIVPETEHKYTPDFPVSPHIVLETKGLWKVEDRMKMLYLIEQYPDISFRMVFQRANQKIKKGSKTSYADWCDKHNILWCEKHLPIEWIHDINDDLAKDQKESS